MEVGLDLPPPDEGKDRPIYDDRLEQVGEIEVQAEGPAVGGVDDPYLGIERRLPYLLEHLVVEDRVAEAYHRVELVARRALRPRPEREPRALHQAVERRVVCAPCAGLDEHECLNGVGVRELLLEVVEHPVRLPQFVRIGATQVVLDNRAHVAYGGVFHGPGHLEPPWGVSVQLALLEERLGRLAVLHGRVHSGQVPELVEVREPDSALVERA